MGVRNRIFNALGSLLLLLVLVLGNYPCVWAAPTLRLWDMAYGNPLDNFIPQSWGGGSADASWSIHSTAEGGYKAQLMAEADGSVEISGWFPWDYGDSEGGKMIAPNNRWMAAFILDGEPNESAEILLDVQLSFDYFVSAVPTGGPGGWTARAAAATHALMKAFLDGEIIETLELDTLGDSVAVFDFGSGHPTQNVSLSLGTMDVEQVLFLQTDFEIYAEAWMTAGGNANAFGLSTLDIQLTPIPIPPAVILLGSGLIGLVGLRKKFRK